MNAQTQSVAPHDAVFQLTTGVFVSGALACLARLGIPDLLEAGPKSPDDLAKEIGADRQAPVPADARHSQPRRVR